MDSSRSATGKNFDADTGKDSIREIRGFYIPNFSRWQDQADYQQLFNWLFPDLKA
jgi:hypothetical protein